MATTYSNLSGTAQLNIEVPYKDTLVYNLKLKDEAGEYQDLSGSDYYMEFYRDEYKTDYIWRATGVLEDANPVEKVTFTKAMTRKTGDYYYRIYRVTAEGIKSTPIRGKLKIS